MLLRLRHKYRRILLRLLPARSYVLEIQATPVELIQRLSSIINPDRMYFFFPSRHEKPYSGRFGTNRFVAIRNNPGNWQRQIKVRGFFYLIGEKIYVRLILSNPFSIVNLLVLGILYFLFLIFWVAPFQQFWLNLLIWLLPVIITYLVTNISFQLVYRKEKQRFFKLFKGRRLGDKEVKALGI